MGQLKGICLTVLVATIVAYYSTTIVPEGFSEPIKIRILMTLIRFVTHVTKFITVFGIEEVHTIRNTLLLLENLVPQHNDSYVHFQDTTFNGVKVRLFTPWSDVASNGLNNKNRDSRERVNVKKRGVVFIHGGGWSIGSATAYHPQTYLLSKELNAVVVSIEYRLAPEHQFPIGFEDCVRATKYFINNAAKFSVDVQRIAIKGDSAGGNLAAAVNLRLRDDRFTPMPKLQVLIYPSLQATDFNTPSMMYNQHGPFLTQRNTVHYKSLYLFGHPRYEALQRVNNHTSAHYKQNLGKKVMNHIHLPNDEIMQKFNSLGDHFGDDAFWEEYKHIYLNPYFSPLHAKTLKNLPETYIVTCQFDVLRDDGFFFAGRLREAGVVVNHKNLRVCFHGWMSFTDRIETTVESFNEIVKYIDRKL